MRRPGFFRVLRNKFVAGLIILVPMVITFQALWWLFLLVEEFARPFAATFTSREIPGLGFISTLAVVLLTGLIFSVGPLKRLLDGLVEVVEVIPFVGRLYGTVKKVFEGFGSIRTSGAFKRFVLARLPGRTTPGFLTGTFELQRADGRTLQLCTVYIPTNHLYVGDVVVLPVEDVLETDLTIEDGVSLILSAGAALPPTIRESRTGLDIGKAQLKP